MEFFDAVAKRHSYRDVFREEAIPDEDLRAILEAAILAPSGWNLQSTHFVAVTDRELIGKIAEVIPMDATKTARAMIVMVTEHIEAEGLCFEVEDYGIACAYIMLAATAMGYATVCLDGDVQEEDHREQLAELIGAPEGTTVRAVFPLGIPVKEMAAAPRKAYEERVSYNRY